MSHLDKLEEGKIYIFADNSYKMIPELKKIIELQKLNCNFIFICHENREPVKQCADRIGRCFRH